jgi:hypothetical protein
MTMKYILAFIFIICISSCDRKTSFQSGSSTQYLKPANSSGYYTIDSLPGYTLRYSTGEGIEVLQGEKKILYARVCPLEERTMSWVKELDSTDLVKGFAMVLAIADPLVGDADGCNTKFSIDSLFEYKNRFNTRCFRIRVKGVTHCIDDNPDSSYYQGYYADVSQGDKITLIEIPNGLDFLNDQDITKISPLLAENVKALNRKE